MFCNKLDNTDWSYIVLENDPSTASTLFHEMFLKHYNECFPIRKTEITYKNKIPWLTVGLKQSISNKNKLYKIAKKYPSKKNVELYKQYKNKLNGVMRKSEREHYDNLINKSSGNSMKTWKVIKTVISKSKIESQLK